MHCSVGFLEHMESWVFPSVKATSDIKAHVSRNQHPPPAPSLLPIPPVTRRFRMAIVFILHVFNEGKIFWLVSPDCSPREVLATPWFNSVPRQKTPHDLSDSFLRQQWVGNPRAVTVHTGHRLTGKQLIFGPIRLVKYLLFPPQRVCDRGQMGNLHTNIFFCAHETNCVQLG